MLARLLLSMCYYSDFGFSEDESSFAEGGEVCTYRGPRVIAPKEIAALNSFVTSEPIASGSCSASMDRLFVGAKKDQGQFQGE